MSSPIAIKKKSPNHHQEKDTSLHQGEVLIGGDSERKEILSVRVKERAREFGGGGRLVFFPLFFQREISCFFTVPQVLKT